MLRMYQISGKSYYCVRFHLTSLFTRTSNDRETDTILVAVLGLLYYATTRYLPSHVRFIAGRAQYYLFGNKDSFYVASNSIDEGINRDL